MAEAPELPAHPLASFAGRAEVVQPEPARSRLLRVGVVLAAGRSERLESVTGWLHGLAPAGGLSLVERAVRSLLAAGLQRVVVVVGHDAGRHCCIERSPRATASTSPPKDDRSWARSSGSTLSRRPSMKESLHLAGLPRHIPAQCKQCL
jgi:CTP:molybdopterin cytidylyltransferase MocA